MIVEGSQLQVSSFKLQVKHAVGLVLGVETWRKVVASFQLQVASKTLAKTEPATWNLQLATVVLTFAFVAGSSAPSNDTPSPRAGHTLTIGPKHELSLLGGLPGEGMLKGQMTPGEQRTRVENPPLRLRTWETFAALEKWLDTQREPCVGAGGVSDPSGTGVLVIAEPDKEIGALAGAWVWHGGMEWERLTLYEL